MSGRAQRLLLQQDSVRVVVEPEDGGAIREFTWRGREIFRTNSASGSGNPLEQACFPMVPFCNRIPFGKFNFAGRNVHVPHNWQGDAHTIHGEGWRGRWSVVDSSDRHVHLAFSGGAAGWPWPYRAEQRIDVDADGVSIELSAVNVGQESMPIMLGLHPYFAIDVRTRLRAHLPRYWAADDTSLPVTECATPKQWGFETAGVEGLPVIDNCFSGWDGVATLLRPEWSVGLHATGCRWLHLYRPVGQDYLCMEPQSSANGALNRDTAEVPVLRPGERSAIGMRVAAEPR